MRRGAGKDCAKMANRAGEHEEVPDKMIVPDLAQTGRFIKSVA
jgi:hypothetical protein